MNGAIDCDGCLPLFSKQIQHGEQEAGIMKALNPIFEIVIDVVIVSNENNHGNKIISELKKTNGPGYDYDNNYNNKNNDAEKEEKEKGHDHDTDRSS